jgi:protein DJ-1
VVIHADKLFSEAAKESFDCVVLPGGLGGAKAMADSKEVGELLKKYEADGKIIAAICAAPTVLLAHSVALGKNITSYPSFKDKLDSKFKYDDHSLVVVDGKLITSRGPGTAFDFGLKLAEILQGKETAEKVTKGLLYEIRA